MLLCACQATESPGNGRQQGRMSWNRGIIASWPLGPATEFKNRRKGRGKKPLTQSLSCVLLWPRSLPPQNKEHILRREETGEGSRGDGEKKGEGRKKRVGVRSRWGRRGKRMTPPGVQKTEELQHLGPEAKARAWHPGTFA